MARALSAAMFLQAAAAACLPQFSSAAEVLTLSERNWDNSAPKGKEADCIYGDLVIRNETIVAVIGKAIPTRNANMTVKNVGGCIIDLTTRENQNDQLSAYYPGGGAYEYTWEGISGGNDPHRTVTVEFRAPQTKEKPAAHLVYKLRDGERFLTIVSTYTNESDKPLTFAPEDRVRADKSFQSGVEDRPNFAWYDDEWFGQTYGIVPVDAKIAFGPEQKTKEGRPLPRLLQFAKDGSANVELAPGKSISVQRRLYPARTYADLHTTLVRWPDEGPLVQAWVSDEKGKLPGTWVSLFRGDERYAWGRTDEKGEIVCPATGGGEGWKLKVSALGRGEVDVPLDFSMADEDHLGGVVLRKSVKLPLPGYVVAKITNDQGGPTPCKVQFRAKGPEKDGKKPADPDFGPDSGEHAVKNLYYSHTGQFRQEIAPGEYDVIISYGPEHDAIFTTLAVERGKEAKLEGVLKRVVKTPGWVSSDFHSHATPSGDNTASQLGRVLNLLCEQIEFAPCTEHNRISSYDPHLAHLDAKHLLATCTGMELTGSLLPVNHQNAFPLVEKPRTQDGGGPQVDNENPVAQIERLALWDADSDKLLQMNHPDVVRILGDRDNDGKQDAGLERMFGFVDVMEVHPPHEIFQTPTSLEEDRKAPNTIFHWMQMLNLGYRIPAVVNTDAHYNFHGSGFLRNYIKSPTDDPAKIKTMDIVHAAEHGNLVVTSGPFVEVFLKKGNAAEPSSLGLGQTARPGDSLSVPDGKATLHVRVQCPNWFDIDRVQVFINGRAEKSLNFTRRENGKQFTRDVVRFDQQIPLDLKADAHVIVAAIGEQSQLGVVMGPTYGQHKPVAVANPIFVDVDGGGFKPNGDLLGLPIPHQEKPTLRRHGHDHDHDHDHDHGHDDDDDHDHDHDHAPRSLGNHFRHARSAS